MSKEDIYEVYWEGPFDKKAFLKQLKRKKAPNAWSLYAMYDDHPLYGADTLTYIGKAVKQTIADRLKQHNWWAKFLYVGTIRKFENWGESNENWNYKDAIKSNEGDDKIVSALEELLIFGLQPAYNRQNKNTANNSYPFRILNTGNLGSLPAEVSGLYHVENVPKVDDLDKE